MEKQKTLSFSPLTTLLFFIITTSFLLPTNASISKLITRQELGLKDENTQTHITFYYHDIISGSNPTVSQIAQATNTNQSTTLFGALYMVDDLLTDGPEPTSTLVGRAQGLQASGDMSVSAMAMIMNVVFQQGDYNGSTLSILGRNQVGEDLRELSVVGGTGLFRFAKGYAQVKTQSSDTSSGDSVAKYDVYVSHADSSGTGGGGVPNTVSGSSSSSGSKSDGSKNNSYAPSHNGVSVFAMGSILLFLSLFYLA